VHGAEARQQLGRWVALGSLIPIAAIGSLARTSQLWLAIAVLLAMAWGALPPVVDAFLGRRPVPLPAPSGAGSVTLAVHIKDEPVSISRASVLAAVASAPTVVVTTHPQTFESLGVSVPVFVGTTIEEAMNRAVQVVETDAVLIMSARSFANVPAATAAAGVVTAGSSWVVGRCYTFNDDGFAPVVRERLRRRLRSSARSAGVELWEPNATVVSTNLMRDQPFEVGRPWGTSMRAWAAAGSHGSENDMTFAVTAEPTNVGSYWPLSIRRRRGAVADLADAVRSGRGRHRLLAFGLLLRELNGYPLTFWLLTPWLLTRVGSFPFRCPLWAFLLLWLLPVMLRWFTERHAHGLRPHPLDEALAIAFDAPASVLALPAAITRRIRPTRVPVPGRPLMVAAFLFAAFSLVPLFTHGTTTERAPAAGLALTELALLWLLAMRAVFQRNWTHRTYRIRCRLRVRVDGIETTTFDVSPTGLSFEAPNDDHLENGRKVTIDVGLHDGTTLSIAGTLLNRRTGRHADTVGVWLHFDPADEYRWMAQLSSAALRSNSDETPSATAGGQRPDWIGRLVIALPVALTAVVVVALCATLMGYRPLIIRSGSMKPRLDAGDLVFIEEVEAKQLEIGDVATVDVGNDETLTHRVRAAVTNGASVTITTRGDANPNDETFTLPSDAMVGRVVAHVPRVGSIVAWAGTSTARRAAGIGVGAYVGISLLVSARRRSTPAIRPW
jgi:signal peptidase I